jgi:hypothetical protein
MILRRMNPTLLLMPTQTLRVADCVRVIGSVLSCQDRQFVLNSTVYVSVCDGGTVATHVASRQRPASHGLLLVSTMDLYWMVCAVRTAGVPANRQRAKASAHRSSAFVIRNRNLNAINLTAYTSTVSSPLLPTPTPEWFDSWWCANAYYEDFKGNEHDLRMRVSTFLPDKENCFYR